MRAVQITRFGAPRSSTSSTSPTRRPGRARSPSRLRRRGNYADTHHAMTSDLPRPGRLRPTSQAWIRPSGSSYGHDPRLLGYGNDPAGNPRVGCTFGRSPAPGWLGSGRRGTLLVLLIAGRL